MKDLDQQALNETWNAVLHGEEPRSEQHPEGTRNSDRNGAGIPPGKHPEKEWTQTELAEALACSDRSIRKYLGKLRDVFVWRSDWQNSQGRYQQWVFDELKTYQRHCCIKFVGADGKLTDNQSPMGFEDYKAIVWQQHSYSPVVSPVEEPATLQELAIVLSSVSPPVQEVQGELVADLEDAIEGMGAIGGLLQGLEGSLGNYADQLADQASIAILDRFQQRVKRNIEQGTKALFQGAK